MLLAVSVISYARTFSQEPSKQGSQPPIQNPNKAEVAEATAPKTQEQKSGEPAVISGVNKAGTSTAAVIEVKAALPSPGNGDKIAFLPAFPTETYVATAYSLHGRTASGRPVARGLIAADPAVLPLGSRVRLEAGTFSGEYVVADTGGGVKGHHVDIWTPTPREAMRFGKRAVKLTVLSYGPKRRAARARNRN